MAEPSAQKDLRRNDDTFQVSSPHLSQPKGGGAVRGIGEKFSANAVTGTGTLSVPIATFPGRSGFGPQLSLSYDSGTGNGPFGLGWHLSLPSITRKTEKGLPKYLDSEESDVFILSGAEDLVPALVQKGASWINEQVPNRQIGSNTYEIRRYRPRIEGLFARIERWSNVADLADVFWRSISKDNISTWFGKSTNSRIVDPSDPTHIFSWLICESRDDKGNAIVYDYAAENSQDVPTELVSEAERNLEPQVRTANRYIQRIRYGNRISHLVQPDLTLATWLFEVVFDYGDGRYVEDAPDANKNIFAAVSAAGLPGASWPARKDPFSNRRSGFEVRTYRLCQRVLMIHHFDELAAEAGVDYLVRATEFEFQASPLVTFLTSVVQSGFVWRKDKAKFLKRSLPRLEFSYSEIPTPAELAAAQIQQPTANDMENLPVGLNGADYFWADLNAEGIAGVVVFSDDTLGFKANLGEGQLGPVKPLGRLPSFAVFGAKTHWQDVTGSGHLDLVADDGFYVRTADGGWDFRYFQQEPEIDFGNADVHVSDQTGDGLADLLIVEGARCTLHESLGAFGYAASHQKWMASENLPERPILLTDMTGDGLPDVVTIRNGSVRYRASLGNGRFGPCVTMDNSPWFDEPDQFDPRRIRLADVDGSGTTDILYLAADGVHLYNNQSGNGWSDPILLPQFQCVDLSDDLSVIDLLGRGTACLVWSSPAPSRTNGQLVYVDLMGGQKPHLLTGTINNLGAETQISYASSTHFYLEDELNGTPWATRLPFPVHVVTRVETFDRVSRNRFVVEYGYHHGYFDGIEREFRGFGMVDQWDTEQMAAMIQSSEFPTGDNIDAASHVPPIHTKTWFHTGVYFGGNRVSDYFAGLLNANDIGEYFREPGLTDAQARTLLLDDTVLPPNLTVDEEREACRALKGSMLRQEIYAVDDSPLAALPYSVTEQNFGIEPVQPQSGQRHAVFFTHPRETTTYHYERKLFPIVAGAVVADGGDTSTAIWSPDPRIQHDLTLQVDPYGNVQSAATINYGRRYDWVDPDADNPALIAQDKACQRLQQIVVAQNSFTVAVLGNQDTYRTPLASEALNWEMRKPVQEMSGAGLTSLYSFDVINKAVSQAGDGLHDIAYEDSQFAAAAANPGQANDYFRRTIEAVRSLYRPDDCGSGQNDPNALLPLGQMQSLALTGERYKLAFTRGLLTQVYQRGGKALLPADPSSVLDGAAADSGGYISSQQGKASGIFPATDKDGYWWLPSGRSFLSVSSGDSASQESGYASKHFYLPLRVRDSFGNISTVQLDNYDFLPLQTKDSLGNLVTAGERLVTNAIDPTVPGNDYRVLQASRLMDANRNRTQLSFDALGLVVATAVLGKPEENLGDSLVGMVADLNEADLLQQLANPLVNPWAILAGATTRLIYDFNAYVRNMGQPAGPQPACVYTMQRETHLADEAGQPTKVQHSFQYSDGFYREIQAKVRAEPDMAGGVAGPPRWVGSGWTIFNNKGKPVLQYEPFFSGAPGFEFGVKQGVGSVLFYDPSGRVVATLHPNHTYEKVVFDPWQQSNYDANDTVAPRDNQTGDPRTDPDIKPVVGRYFQSQSVAIANAWKTWYAQRNSGDLGQLEQQAAKQAADQANTPTTAYFDTLGRPFLTLAHNRVVCAGHSLDGTEDLFATRILKDIEGNDRQVIDAQGRVVMNYDYDMLGDHLHQASMEAGERWMLSAIDGKSIRAWDSRGHNFRIAYDELRRPTERYVLGTSVDSDPRTKTTELLFDRIEYGEALPKAATLNLLARVYRHSDTAGAITNAAFNPIAKNNQAYDFKGNLLRSSRQLQQAYTEIPDWKNNAQADGNSFIGSTTYDALNRPIQAIEPHSDQVGTRLDVTQYSYNERKLLNRVDVWLKLASEPGVLDPAVTAPSRAGVTGISYDPKGQRQSIDYSNGVGTRYSYDAVTFRLKQLLTTRSAAEFPNDCPNNPPAGWPGCQIQNLNYTYDPMGNITWLEDDAQQGIFFRNLYVGPSAEYVYDATYRLIQAKGREHLGQMGAPVPYSYNDAPSSGIQWSGNDCKAMGRYTEQYVYDSVGNFDEMSHVRTEATVPNWTRTYAYDEASQIEGAKKSNRLSATAVNGVTEKPPYSLNGDGYDFHGNMLKMPQLQVMQWDFLDRLFVTQRQKVNAQDADGIKHQGEQTYYVYDSTGARARKITERPAGTVKNERIYLGKFELYSEPGANLLVRETLHVMDDNQRIALIESRTTPTTANAKDPLQLIRYQFGDHLGSSALELDDAATIVSYEIFTPYGDSAYQAMGGQTSVSKRYRFIGKERDEESGLSYVGLRYYIPWVAKWASADPLGIIDGSNLYQYARMNPVKFVDASGAAAGDWDELRAFVNAEPTTKKNLANQQCNSHHPKEVRHERSRGGFTVVSGLILLGGGLAAIPTGGASIFAALAATMAIGTGLAVSVAGTIQMGASLSGKSTPAQDANALSAINTVALLGSPASLALGTLGAGVSKNPEHGLRVGATIGNLADLAISGIQLAVALSKGARSLRASGGAGEGFVDVPNQVTARASDEEAAMFGRMEHYHEEQSLVTYRSKEPITRSSREIDSVSLGPATSDVLTTLHGHPASKVARFSVGDVDEIGGAAFLKDVQHSVLGLSEKWDELRAVAAHFGLAPPPLVPMVIKTTARQADIEAARALLGLP